MHGKSDIPILSQSSTDWYVDTIYLITCHLEFTQVCIAVYNVFFHPLSRYPGSVWWAMSRVPYLMMVWSGEEHRRVLEMHDRYGEVVRLAPDELS